jgi:hypothetical protein
MSIAMFRVINHDCIYEMKETNFETGLRHVLPVDPTKWVHTVYFGYTSGLVYTKAELRFSLNGSLITTLPLAGFFVLGPVDIGFDLDNQQTNNLPFFDFAQSSTLPLIRSTGFRLNMTMDEVSVNFLEIRGASPAGASGLAVCSS